MRREADATSFRGACFAAARSIGARVELLAFPGISSFHAVTIAGRDEAHTVLRHAVLPLVACTATPPAPGRPVAGFVDPPAWAACFEAVGLRALRVHDLDTPIAEVAVDGPTAADHADDIRYWRPEVLSDLLFNWWD